MLQYVLEGLHGEMNRSEQPPPKKKEKPEVKVVEVDEQNGNGSTDENDNAEKDVITNDLLNSELDKLFNLQSLRLNANF